MLLSSSTTSILAIYRLLLDGEFNGEFSTFVDQIFHTEGNVVFLENSSTERQTETTSQLLCRKWYKIRCFPCSTPSLAAIRQLENDIIVFLSGFDVDEI